MSVGIFVERYWDSIARTSRPALPTDAPSGVFKAFVPHPVARWAPDIDEETAECFDAAERDLALLAADFPPNAEFPAEWLLRRAESTASSTIEGVHPSARRLARAEAQLSLFDDPPKSSDLEALRNITATELALDLGASGRVFLLEDLLSIHAAQMGADHPEGGRLRTRQNWIASRHFSTPLDASYVPPPPETVPSLIDDLLEAINSRSVRPLLAVGVAHAQFEAIHPFADGNGRTGRALIHFMLRRLGLTSVCTVPVSSSLARQRNRYLDALDESHSACDAADPRRGEALKPWLCLFAESIHDATGYARRVIAHIAAINELWRAQVSALGVRSNNAALRMLEHLPRRPILNLGLAMQILGASKHTANRCLTTLEQAGVLVQRSAGKRNRVYEAQAVTDAFASLAAISGPNSTVQLPHPISQSVPPDPQNRCGAKTLRGKPCKHPRPAAGNKCQAGHKREQ